MRSFHCPSSEIGDAVETYIHVYDITLDQHNDWSSMWDVKDKCDIDKLHEWFSDWNLFTNMKELVSLSTGVVASNQVDHHVAHKKGTNLVSQLHGMRFSDVEFSRSTVVKTMKTTKLKIRDENMAINPLIIFKRNPPVTTRI